MSFPILENSLVLDTRSRDQLEGLVAQLQTFLAREHKGTGEHGAIHATSLTVSGGILERHRKTAMGVWTDVPYRATDFTALGGMIWTVDAADVQLRRFTVVGQTLLMNVALVTTTVGGVVSGELRMALPAGYKVARTVNTICFINDAGTGNVPGLATSVVGETFVRLQKPTGANWAVSANATSIYATLTLEVTG